MARVRFTEGNKLMQRLAIALLVLAALLGIGLGLTTPASGQSGEVELCHVYTSNWGQDITTPYDFALFQDTQGFGFRITSVVTQATPLSFLGFAVSLNNSYTPPIGTIPVTGTLESANPPVDIGPQGAMTHFGPGLMAGWNNPQKGVTYTQIWRLNYGSQLPRTPNIGIARWLSLQGSAEGSQCPSNWIVLPTSTATTTSAATATPTRTATTPPTTTPSATATTPPTAIPSTTTTPSATPTLEPPTAIQLTALEARWVSKGVEVKWSTAIELNTWGYQVFRSETNNLSQAIEVTRQLILARGGTDTGASYSFLDVSANPNHKGQYYYWLVEVERGGSTHEYGPVQATRQIYLPLVKR